MAELAAVMAGLSQLHLHDTAAIVLDKQELDYLLHLDSQQTYVLQTLRKKNPLIHQVTTMLATFKNVLISRS